ncbi:hypothetical protein DH2020_037471 [Rehmannia glutinosa]|uniref:Trichome birefringence-like N-terminal domain-containing protein n=1 Tax=Rehmannia glutinosa TaxID=99300 RepID=A0ABR0V188_REHGL
MKFQASELPLGKPQSRRSKTSKLAPLIALTILLTIPLYYPTIRDSSKKLSDTSHVFDESLERTNHQTHLPFKTPPQLPKSAETSRGPPCELLPPPRRQKETAAEKETEKPQTDSVIAQREEINNNDKTQITITSSRGDIRSRLLDDEMRLIFREWVPNPEGPYYTNDTCNAIQEHQNCLKFGRPDRILEMEMEAR